MHFLIVMAGGGLQMDLKHRGQAQRIAVRVKEWAFTGGGSK